eukprot:1159268-Pelagomonas_calceolata.AAC.6
MSAFSTATAAAAAAAAAEQTKQESQLECCLPGVSFTDQIHSTQEGSTCLAVPALSWIQLAARSSSSKR